MSGLGEPYAWRFIISGERGPDGVPYTAFDTGPDAYETPEIREAMEKMTRQAFSHQHPGVGIASTRWYPLHDIGGDDE